MFSLAAGFKLYSALFGLLWIKERKYKDTLRLLLYGVLAFFAPFVFFGGINGIIDYIGTFTRYMTKEMYSQTSILGNCITLFGEHGKNIGRAMVCLWILWVVFKVFSTRGGVENNCPVNEYTYDSSC